MNFTFKNLILFSGPGLYLLLQLIGGPKTLPEPAFDVLCITLWMAIWWVTEVVPIIFPSVLNASRACVLDSSKIVKSKNIKNFKRKTFSIIGSYQ